MFYGDVTLIFQNGSAAVFNCNSICPAHVFTENDTPSKENCLMVYNDLSYFIGTLANGRKECPKGLMIHSNGDTYIGEFSHDSKKLGQMTYSNGDIYFGEWKND